MSPGATYYVQVRDTLQSGATFYVSSATINTANFPTSFGPLTAGQIAYGSSSNTVISTTSFSWTDGLLYGYGTLKIRGYEEIDAPIVHGFGEAVSTFTFTPSSNQFSSPSSMKLVSNTGKGLDIIIQDSGGAYTTWRTNSSSALSPNFELSSSGGPDIVSMGTNTGLSVLDPGGITATYGVASSTLSVTGANGASVTYGLTAGSVTVTNLTASQFVKTDSNKKLSSSLLSASDLPGGNTSYIQLTSSLQSGATFFVSSGTVQNLNLSTIQGVTPGLVAGTNISSITGTWPNQTINATTQSGGGGSSSSLAVNQNAVTITSPTVALNALSPPFIITSINGGTTAQWALDPSSVTERGTLWSFAVDASTAGALTQSSATLTYVNVAQGLTQASAASTYLTQSSATATYPQTSSVTVTYLNVAQGLTQSSATATYLNVAQGLTQSSASITYVNVAQGLTQSSASVTYVNVAQGLTQSSASVTYVNVAQGLTQSSATATYLQSSSATATYLQSSSATATYLPTVNAATLYLTQSSATATYPQTSSITATYLQSSSAPVTYLNIAQGLTQSSATATYLQTSSATATYIQASSAAATYFNKANLIDISANTNLAVTAPIVLTNDTVSLSPTIGQVETFTSSATHSASVVFSSNVVLSNGQGTSGQVFTTGVGGAPTWSTPSGVGGTPSSGTIVQVIQSTATPPSSTTSTSFANTGLQATITPIAPSDQIKITVSGVLSNASAVATAFATISKGTVNLLSANGQCSESGLAAGAVPCTMVFIDQGPLTLSATTYFTQIMTSNGGFATTWGGTNQLQTMILEEFSPSGGVAGVGLLQSTQTWTGIETWSNPQRSTFTVAPAFLGLTAGDLVIDGSGIITSTPAFTPNTNDTLTNKTINAESAGNVITIPLTIMYKAGLCQAGTASLGFSYYTSSGPTATCLASTSTIVGAAGFVDGSTLTVQDHFRLPSDWTGNIDVQLVWVSSITVGQVAWEARTACVSSGTIANPTWNAYNTVNSLPSGIANNYTEASMSALTVTGCTSNSEFYFELARNGGNPTTDTHKSTAMLITALFTMRRAL